MKAAVYIAPMQTWLGGESFMRKPYTINTVQLYKVPQSREKIFYQHRKTLRQDARLQDKRLAETAQFNQN